MSATALRKELQGYIKTMPEQKLTALKPLLRELAEPDFVIEPASPSERKRAEKRLKEYRENPDSFVSLEEYKKSRGITEGAAKRAQGKTKK
jgi:hypothetical protein